MANWRWGSGEEKAWAYEKRREWRRFLEENVDTKGLAKLDRFIEWRKKEILLQKTLGAKDHGQHNKMLNQFAGEV